MNVRRAAWWEDWGVRGLYFFNTIDTHTLVAVTVALGVLYWPVEASWIPTSTVCSACESCHLISWRTISTGLFLVLLPHYVAYRLADFHPAIIPVGLLVVLVHVLDSGRWLLLGLTAAAVAAYVLISQLFLLGLPNVLVKRDWTIPFRMMINALTTIAPTTTSTLMSFIFPFLIAGAAVTLDYGGVGLAGTGLAVLTLAALIVRRGLRRYTRPLPPVVLKKQPQQVRRIIMLNIDGMRLDIFRRAEYGLFREWERQGVSFPRGLTTVYRALTNPAFASILTGVHPPVHGLLSNNYGARIKVTGLPDLFPTRLYGSMHIRHFSKPSWECAVATLIGQSTLDADRALMTQLREDVAHDRHKLHIYDLSNVDHTGHVYGSENRAYADALFPAQELLWEFFCHLRDTGFFADGACFLMSDHGIAGIDHSYMLHPAERYVPFIAVGPGMPAGHALTLPANITDIAPTICALFGRPPVPGMLGRILPLWE